MHPLRRAAITGLTIAAVAIVTPAAQATNPGDAMVASINAVRSTHHLAPLATARALTRGATSHSHNMLANGCFAHAKQLHAASFGTVGEIIEWHTGSVRVRKAMQAWLNSPPHRALILTAGFRYAGAGWATGKRRTFWTVRFGSR